MNQQREDIITDKELSECDREQLHLLGSIQGEAGHILFFTYPIGEIVAVDAKIDNVSWIKNHDQSDTSTVINLPEMMIGMNLTNFISDEIVEKIFQGAETMKRANSKRTFLFCKSDINSYALSLTTNTSDYSLFGLEIESILSTDEERTYQETLMYLGQIMEFYSEDAIASTACETIFKFVKGYDRGMVYRFHDDLSGDIIHEIKSDFLDSSYNGMRFPASDIPLPARQLYITNGMRYIHNVEANDTPIISNQKEVDLTQCRIRAVAKPHIIYLRNMGVCSSLSLPIVVEGELWGLLAYHAYQKAFKPSMYQRIACEAVAKMVSVRIEASVNNEKSRRAVELGDALMSWDPNESVMTNISDLGDDLLSILEIDVICAVIHDDDGYERENESIIIGNNELAPGDKFWKQLVGYTNQEILYKSTREEIRKIGLSETDCPASGFMFFREGRLQVFLGRGLRSQDVRWAGNPDAAKLRIDGVLNPRSSFDAFMEKARNESRYWTKNDLTISQIFCERVCGFLQRWMIKILESNIDESNAKYVLAIERSRENSQFFAHLSHELRTPFHGVMGCLNLLNDSVNEGSKEELKDLAKTALNTGSHMLTLLNDILNVAKDKYFANTINCDSVIYQSLVFEVVNGFKSLTISRNMRLESDVYPNEEKIFILTDKTKITQIISNLLNNAIKFGNEGTAIQLSFRLLASKAEAFVEWAAKASCHRGSVFCAKEDKMITSIDEAKLSLSDDKSGGSVKWFCFSISDAGCGMLPEELVSMFEPYTQAKSGRSRTFQGTGLGLFISVSLCLQLKGFIACSSTPQVGTIFYVAVPVEVSQSKMQPSISVPNVQDNSANGNTASSATSNMGNLSFGRSNITGPIVITGPILLVDDNVVNLKILQRQINVALKKASLDVKIVTAGSGELAVEEYKKSKPSLIVMDYHMPGIDGAEACREIRDVEREQNLQHSYVIAYTADVTDEALHILFSSGSDETLTKPPPRDYCQNLVSRFDVIKP